jgi:hypothetical protein
MNVAQGIGFPFCTEYFGQASCRMRCGLSANLHCESKRARLATAIDVKKFLTSRIRKEE